MVESQHREETASRPLLLNKYAAVVVFIVGYAALAAVARPLTLPASFTVLVPGLALVVWGTRRIPNRTHRTTRATVATWFTLLGLFCVWELVAFGWGNDQGHPTLSLAFDPVLENYPARVIGYVIWLSTGAWVATR
ncbi:hypothetical protein O7635_02055 [Asanoa sp. WMMD1127]|uniref:hypothetical protein n=1 Tax=Asanoa sp. WMMD1127 TaxID=3016107 RepID=UPI0024173E5F|nr:hypothetical protein [Asanoa sp. WMMD1127]MDG4820634.1 hypothetical protein [Asanoa sp. WMMD1127]